LVEFLHMELIATALPWAQVALSALLIAAILLQQSGTDTGGALGGGEGSSWQNSKRGVEKILFNATIIIALLFAVSSFLALVVR